MYILLGIISTGIMNQFFFMTCCLLLIMIIYMIIKRRSIIIHSKSFILLLAFEISYYVLLKVNNIDVAVYKIICPIIMYYCGATIYILKKENDLYINKCIISICVGLFLHAMLNFATNIGSTTRNTIDIWTHQYLAATLQGTMLTMILSMLFYVYGTQKNIKVKIVYGICFALSIMYLLTLGSRTQIIITIIVCVFETILYNVLNKDKKRVKMILKSIIIVLIMIVAYNINIFGIKDVVHESNLYKRLGQSETKESDNNRLETQILAFKSMLENPFGNEEKIGNLNYAHNMWLDIGKEVGIIPCLLLIGYTISTLKSLYYIIKSKNVGISLEYKILVTSIYLGVNINFFTEPIMQGIPFFFIMVTLINGMVDAQYYHLKKEKEDEDTLDSKHDISISSKANRT